MYGIMHVCTCTCVCCVCVCVCVHDVLLAVPQVVKEEGTGKPCLTLTPRGRYSEQLRHLLTIHSGKVPLDILPRLYYAEFGKPKQEDIASWLHKKPIRWASHVVHLAATQWIVWAPTSQAYPNTRTEPQSLLPPDHTEVDPDILLELPQGYNEQDAHLFEATATIDFPIDLLEVGEENKKPESSQSSAISLVSEAPSEDSGVCYTTGEWSSENLHSVSQEEEGKMSKLAGSAHDFSNKTPEAVLEMMRAELKVEDGGNKISKMGPYLQYFGELSEKELDRVEGSKPKPVPRIPRQKPGLAIRFPGPPTAIPRQRSSVPKPLSEFQRLVEETERERKRKPEDMNEKEEEEKEEEEEEEEEKEEKMEEEEEVEEENEEEEVDSPDIAGQQMSEMALMEELIKPLPEMSNILDLMSDLTLPSADVTDKQNPLNPFSGEEYLRQVDPGYSAYTDDASDLFNEQPLLLEEIGRLGIFDGSVTDGFLGERKPNEPARLGHDDPLHPQS